MILGSIPNGAGPMVELFLILLLQPCCSPVHTGTLSATFIAIGRVLASFSSFEDDGTRWHLWAETAEVPLLPVRLLLLRI